LLQFKLQNVKCTGCASTIRDGLGKLAGVEQVEVDVASGTVQLQGDVPQDTIRTTLAQLGYPVIENDQ